MQLLTDWLLPQTDACVYTVKIPFYRAFSHGPILAWRYLCIDISSVSENTARWQSRDIFREGEGSVCIRCKKRTSFSPFGIQFQHRRILHQHHHRLAFSWAQSFLAGATATYYLLPESDAIWCEHISCKFNFYSRGAQACLMPPHKPGNTHAKKWWLKKRKVLCTMQMKMSNYYTLAHTTEM